jgi:hypothetical protein
VLKIKANLLSSFRFFLRTSNKTSKSSDPTYPTPHAKACSILENFPFSKVDMIPDILSLHNTNVRQFCQKDMAGKATNYRYWLMHQQLCKIFLETLCNCNQHLHCMLQIFKNV